MIYLLYTNTYTNPRISIPILVDSAFLFLQPTTNKGGLDAVKDKEEIKTFILKSLSQKGDPVDALKIYKVGYAVHIIHNSCNSISFLTRYTDNRGSCRSGRKQVPHRGL